MARTRWVRHYLPKLNGLSQLVFALRDATGESKSIISEPVDSNLFALSQIPNKCPTNGVFGISRKQSSL